jgi:hypothetical protein
MDAKPQLLNFQYVSFFVTYPSQCGGRSGAVFSRQPSSKPAEIVAEAVRLALDLVAEPCLRHVKSSRRLPIDGQVHGPRRQQNQAAEKRAPPGPGDIAKLACEPISSCSAAGGRCLPEVVDDWIDPIPVSQDDRAAARGHGGRREAPAPLPHGRGWARRNGRSSEARRIPRKRLAVLYGVGAPSANLLLVPQLGSGIFDFIDS